MPLKKTLPGNRFKQEQKVKSAYEKAGMAIQQNADELKRRFPVINTIAIGILEKPKNHRICVDIFITGKSKAPFPKRLKVKYSKNTYGYVPVEIIHSDLCGKSHATVLRPGTFIFLKNKPGSFGTLGCFAKSTSGNKKYFITCNHVLTSDNFQDGATKGEIVATKHSGVKTDIGSWQFGKMDAQIDVAVCEFNKSSGAVIQNESFTYDNKDTDPALILSAPVEVNGKNNSTYTGYVVNADIDFEIRYANKKILLQHVILLSANLSADNYKTLTSGGDSGALVVTPSDQSIIGIVVGGDSKFTCVIPFNRINNELKKLSITL